VAMDGHGEDGTRDGTTPSNVLPLRREWFGPHAELIPFGARSGPAAGSSAGRRDRGFGDRDPGEDAAVTALGESPGGRAISVLRPREAEVEVEVEVGAEDVDLALDARDFWTEASGTLHQPIAAPSTERAPAQRPSEDESEDIVEPATRVWPRAPNVRRRAWFVAAVVGAGCIAGVVAVLGLASGGHGDTQGLSPSAAGTASSAGLAALLSNPLAPTGSNVVKRGRRQESVRHLNRHRQPVPGIARRAAVRKSPERRPPEHGSVVRTKVTRVAHAHTPQLPETAQPSESPTTSVAEREDPTTPSESTSLHPTDGVAGDAPADTSSGSSGGASGASTTASTPPPTVESTPPRTVESTRPRTVASTRPRTVESTRPLTPARKSAASSSAAGSSARTVARGSSASDCSGLSLLSCPKTGS
jgi:hypothetical protein